MHPLLLSGADYLDHTAARDHRRANTAAHTLEKLARLESILAATALHHDLDLAAHNTAGFAWIPGLRLLDPLE